MSLIIKPRYQSESKRRRSEANRKSRYNLSPKGFDEFLEKQDGKCPICGANITLFNVAQVDHSRMTGKVRGLLCRRCNSANGMYGDDPKLLQKAADYLLDHLKTVT